MHTQKRRALQQYEKQLGQHITAELKPSKTLQAELTEPFHRRVLDELVRASDPTQRKRLNDLATPHATSWTTDSARFCIFGPDEFRCG